MSWGRWRERSSGCPGDQYLPAGSQATAILSKQFSYISKESMLSLNMKRFIQVNSILEDKDICVFFIVFLVNKLKL